MKSEAASLFDQQMPCVTIEWEPETCHQAQLP